MFIICTLIFTLVPQSVNAADGDNKLGNQESETKINKIEDVQENVYSDVLMEGILCQGQLIEDEGNENPYLKSKTLKSSGNVKGYFHDNADIPYAKMPIDKKELDAIVGRLTNMDKIHVNATSVVVNVEGYGIHINNIKKTISYIFNVSPELFFYGNTYEYWCSPPEGMVTAIKFTFEKGESVKSIKAKQKKIENQIGEFNSLVDHSMSDLEIALLAHDYLATHVAYHEEESNVNRYDIYGALVLKKAVCQGYALSYELLLAENGVECGVASSQNTNHAWNVVRLDGQWYHVDVTWDDPVKDVLGQVKHNFMLLSDEGLFAMENCNGRKDYVTADENSIYRKAVDDSYQGYFWENSNGLIHYYKNNWYYMDKDSMDVYRRNCDTGSKALICDGSRLGLNSKWNDQRDNKYYKGNLSRVVAMKDNFYFSTPKKIYNLKLNGEYPCYEVYSHNSNDGQIFGLGQFDNELKYAYGDFLYEQWEPFLVSTGINLDFKTRLTEVTPDYNSVKLKYNTISIPEVNGDKTNGRFMISYKLYGDEKYKNVYTSRDSYTIENLDSNRSYYVKVTPYYKVNGKNVYGEETKTVKFVTNPVNKYITRGKISRITYSKTRSKVYVKTVLPYIEGGRVTCQVAYRKASNGTYKTKSFKGTSVDLTGLSRRTTYRVKLRYLYTDNETGKKAYSRFSSLETFKTK